MLAPPPLPAAALTAGKVVVALTWAFGFYGWLAVDPASIVHTTGFWLLVTLAGSHIIEIAIYRAFLQAARATAADYVQVFLFGIFHSAGLKPQQGSAT